MKSLQEYIDRYEVNYDNPRFWATTERLSIDCEDLFGNVPATSKEIFCNTCNMIEETLIMSHSSTKLQNELQKIFSNLKFEDIVDKTKMIMQSHSKSYLIMKKMHNNFIIHLERQK